MSVTERGQITVGVTEQQGSAAARLLDLAGEVQRAFVCTPRKVHARGLFCLHTIRVSVEDTRL